MKTVRLRLPATSANLGSGFDAMALALEIFLEIEAAPAVAFHIDATGRDHELCGRMEKNLLIETYRGLLEAEQRPVTPLAIKMRNGIPLGMGCGSSAAARLAAVALAVQFGNLGWEAGKIVEEAAGLEGHPDNVAACWHGGLTVAASGEGRVVAVSIPPPPGWRALLVLPDRPLATAKARSVLPETYSREDAVMNLQSAALLTAAFAVGRPDLLRLATRDRLHQPYRAQLCPLLPALLPLAGKDGVLSVTLSGAGPAVLLLTMGGLDPALKREIAAHSHSAGPLQVVEAELCRKGAKVSAAD